MSTWFAPRAKNFAPVARHSLLLALEPRQIFDGAVGAAVADATADPHADQNQPAAPAPQGDAADGGAALADDLAQGGAPAAGAAPDARQEGGDSSGEERGEAESGAAAALAWNGADAEPALAAVDGAGLIISDGKADLSAISISAQKAGDGPHTLALSTDRGVFSCALASDRISIENGGSTLIFRDMSAAEINAALKSCALDLDGGDAAAVAWTLDGGGAQGASGAFAACERQFMNVMASWESGDHKITIDITTGEGEDKFPEVISAAGTATLDGITVASQDPDAVLHLEISVRRDDVVTGKLSIGPEVAGRVSLLSGNGASTLVIEGTAVNINAVLKTLNYEGAAFGELNLVCAAYDKSAPGEAAQARQELVVNDPPTLNVADFDGKLTENSSHPEATDKTLSFDKIIIGDPNADVGDVFDFTLTIEGAAGYGVMAFSAGALPAGWSVAPGADGSATLTINGAAAAVVTTTEGGAIVLKITGQSAATANDILARTTFAGKPDSDQSGSFNVKMTLVDKYGAQVENADKKVTIAAFDDPPVADRAALDDPRNWLAVYEKNKINNDGAAEDDDGSSGLLALDMFHITDRDTLQPDGAGGYTDASLEKIIITIQRRPEQGELYLLTYDQDGKVVKSSILGEGAAFSLLDVKEGRIKYVHDGRDVPSDGAQDGFNFTVSDGTRLQAQEPAGDGSLKDAIAPFTLHIWLNPYNDDFSAGSSAEEKGAASNSHELWVWERQTRVNLSDGHADSEGDVIKGGVGIYIDAGGDDSLKNIQIIISNISGFDVADQYGVKNLLYLDLAALQKAVNAASGEAQAELQAAYDALKAAYGERVVEGGKFALKNDDAFSGLLIKYLCYDGNDCEPSALTPAFTLAFADRSGAARLDANSPYFGLYNDALDQPITHAHDFVIKIAPNNDDPVMDGASTLSLKDGDEAGKLPPPAAGHENEPGRFFIDVNDDLYVKITSKMLHVTDDDNPSAQMLAFTLTETPVNGYIVLNRGAGEAIVGKGMSFTQDDVDKGYVSFRYTGGGEKHIGSDGVTYYDVDTSFRFTVSDGGITSWLDIHGDGSAYEGDYKDTAHKGGIYGDWGPGHPNPYAPGGTLKVFEFSLELCVAERVGGYGTIFVPVENTPPEAYVKPGEVPLIAEEPYGGYKNEFVLTARDYGVYENGKLVGWSRAYGTDGMINIFDQESSPESLVISLFADPAGGDLWIDRDGDGAYESKLAVGDSFSYADLVKGRVKYVHGGGEVFKDALSFVVSDGTYINTDHPLELAVNIIPYNDAPALSDGAAVINEGESFLVNPHADDVDGAGSTKPLYDKEGNYRLSGTWEGDDFKLDAPPATGELQYTSDGGLNWTKVETWPLSIHKDDFSAYRYYEAYDISKGVYDSGGHVDSTDKGGGTTTIKSYDAAGNLIFAAELGDDASRYVITGDPANNGKLQYYDGTSWKYVELPVSGITIMKDDLGKYRVFYGSEDTAAPLNEGNFSALMDKSGAFGKKYVIVQLAEAAVGGALQYNKGTRENPVWENISENFELTREALDGGFLRVLIRDKVTKDKAGADSQVPGVSVTPFVKDSDNFVYIVEKLPAHGYLKISDGSGGWTTLVEGQEITKAQADTLRYFHKGDEDSTDSFKLTVKDRSQEAGGERSSTAAFNVTVRAINDAPYKLDKDGANDNARPVIDGAGNRANEDGTEITIGGKNEVQADEPGIWFGDDDNPSLAQRTYIVTEACKYGTLYLADSGRELGVGATFTQADLDGGRVRYKADGSNRHKDSFAFQVSDGSLSAGEQWLRDADGMLQKEGGQLVKDPGSPAITFTYQIDTVPENEAPNFEGSASREVWYQGSAGYIEIKDWGVDEKRYVQIYDKDWVGYLDGVTKINDYMELAVSTHKGAKDGAWDGTLAIRDADGGIISGAITAEMLAGLNLPAGIDASKLIGLEISVGTSADQPLMFKGRMEAINEALKILTYEASSDLNDYVHIQFKVNDCANGGPGSDPSGWSNSRPDALKADKFIRVYVSTQNDAPEPNITSPRDIMLVEDSYPRIFGGVDFGSLKLEFSDKDDLGAAANTVTIKCKAGSLLMTGIAASAYSVATENGIDVITITGTLKDLNAALAKIQYNTKPHANGETNAITVTCTDSGNINKTGGYDPATKQTSQEVTFNVKVYALNDAPEVKIISDQDAKTQNVNGESITTWEIKDSDQTSISLNGKIDISDPYDAGQDDRDWNIYADGRDKVTVTIHAVDIYKNGAIGDLHDPADSNGYLGSFTFDVAFDSSVLTSAEFSENYACLTLTGAWDDVQAALDALYFNVPGGGKANSLVKIIVEVNDHGNGDEPSVPEAQRVGALSDADVFLINVNNSENTPPAIGGRDDSVTVAEDLADRNPDPARGVTLASLLDGGALYGGKLAVGDDNIFLHEMTFTITVAGGTINDGVLGADGKTTDKTSISGEYTLKQINEMLQKLYFKADPDRVDDIAISVTVDDNGNTGNVPYGYARQGDTTSVTVDDCTITAGADGTWSTAGARPQGMAISTDADKSVMITFTGEGGVSQTLRVMPDGSVALPDGRSKIIYDEGKLSLQSTKDFIIKITPVNDPPTVSVPGGYTVAEEGTLHLGGITIADPDMITDADKNSAYTVVLEVEHGTLDFAGYAGIEATGDGTDTITLSGSYSAITAMLEANKTRAIITYAPQADLYGANADALTVTVHDNQSIGDGYVNENGQYVSGKIDLTDSKTVNISIDPVNDAPRAAVPAQPYAAREDTALALHGLDFSDVDIKPGQENLQYSITLSVEHGTLAYAGETAGLTISGAGEKSITITGSYAALKTILSGNKISYTSDLHYNGPDKLTFTVSDMGNVGGAADAPLTDRKTADITVKPMNDAPRVTDPAQPGVENPQPVSVLPDQTEDTDAAGSTVRDLFGGYFDDGIDKNTEAHTATEPNTFNGVFVTASGADPATQGVWQYYKDGAWHTLTASALSENAAVYLSADTLIRFEAVKDYSGTPGKLTVRLVENHDTYVSGDNAGQPTSGECAGLEPAALAAGSAYDISGAWSGGATHVGTEDLHAQVTIKPQNDAPTPLRDEVSLPPKITGKDSGGKTVADLFGDVFDDTADDQGGSNPNTFNGVFIVGTEATAGQGVWQYSTDGGVNWSDLKPEDLSDSTAVYLDKNALIRFVDEDVFVGEPGALKARLAENPDGVIDDGVASGPSGEAVPLPGGTGGPVSGRSYDLSHEGMTGGKSHVSGNIVKVVVVVTDYIFDEDSASNQLNAFSVHGLGEDGASHSYTFKVDNGKLSFSGGDGLTVACSGTATVTITGTYADLSAALAGGALKYTPKGDFYGIDKVTVSVDIAGASPKFVELVVTPVNDAPKLPSGTANAKDVAPSSFKNLDEGSSTPGETVLDLFGGYYHDQADHRGEPDFDVPAQYAFAGALIVGDASHHAKQGFWEYSTDGGQTWARVNLGPGEALYLDKSAQLRFAPAADFVGEAGKLTVRLVDGTLALIDKDDKTSTPLENGGKVSFDSDKHSGYTSAVSNADNSLTISASFAPVNDAPAATAASVALNDQSEDIPVDPAHCKTVRDMFGPVFDDSRDEVENVGGVKLSGKNTFNGIFVIGSNATPDQGVWQHYDSATSSWVDINPGLGKALYLDADAKIRFLSVQDYNGEPGALIARLVENPDSVAGSGPSGKDDPLPNRAIDDDPAAPGGLHSGKSYDLSASGATGGKTHIGADNIEITVLIKPVHDAPEWKSGFTPEINAQGKTVADIFGPGFDNGRDSRFAGGANDFKGIRISDVISNPAEGVWQYSTDGGATWKEVLVGPAVGLDLDKGDMLRFSPAQGFHGQTSGSLEVRLVDDYSGTNQGDIGGMGAFSAAVRAVAARIDAPPPAADRALDELTYQAKCPDPLDPWAGYAEIPREQQIAMREPVPTLVLRNELDEPAGRSMHNDLSGIFYDTFISNTVNRAAHYADHRTRLSFDGADSVRESASHPALGGSWINPGLDSLARNAPRHGEQAPGDDQAPRERGVRPGGAPVAAPPDAADGADAAPDEGRKDGGARQGAPGEAEGAQGEPGREASQRDMDMDGGIMAATASFEAMWAGFGRGDDEADRLPGAVGLDQQIELCAVDALLAEAEKLWRDLAS